MIHLAISPETAKLVGIVLIAFFAIAALAAFAALIYSILRQRRNDRETLPALDGFGGVETSKHEEGEAEDDAPSVFYIDEDNEPLPGLDDAEGEEFLRETRKAQRRSEKARRGIIPGRSKK